MVVKKFCVPDRLSTLQQIGYVIVVSRKLSVRFVFTTPQSGHFDANCLGVIWSSLTGN